MIRKIVTGSILLATLVSITSVTHVVRAVEPDLNLDFSAYQIDMSNNKKFAAHAFSWTPDLALRKRVINIYERLLLPANDETSGLSFTEKEAEQRFFSFEVYQGDGLDDLRSRSNHNNITLPDEDTSAYGFKVKQRF